MKITRLVTLIWSLLVPALMLQNAVQATATPAQFGSKWQALLGEWKGETASGDSAGACGFHLDLAEHIMVRTNHAVLAPTDGAEAKAHDDLMVIYPGPQPDKAKAIYFDNEGHVIEYTAEWSADGNTLTFLSTPNGGPQFRLIYQKEDAKSFSVSFAIAAPGQGAFKVYTSGKIKR